MDSSQHMYNNRVVQQEFILGDNARENDFTSSDFQSIVGMNDNVVVKEEPSYDDCFEIFDDTLIKEESYCLENETDSVSPTQLSDHGYFTNFGDSNIVNNSPYILNTVHPNYFSPTGSCNTGMNSVESTNDLVSIRGSSCAEENNSETVLLCDVQGRLPGSSFSTLRDFGSVNENVQTLAFVTSQPLYRMIAPKEKVIEEVQLKISNKWMVSRGEYYANLSILSGIPNPQVTKSIFITKEGIQIFIHKLPLKNNHKIWSLLEICTAVEKGQRLNTLVNEIEKMKICSGCSDQKCRELWELQRFRERGFVEFGFSPSPVYRSLSCQLLMDSLSLTSVCQECKTVSEDMAKVISKRKNNLCDPEDLDKIRYSFLSKAVLETSLRESRKEVSMLRKQIVTLEREIDVWISERTGRQNGSVTTKAL